MVLPRTHSLLPRPSKCFLLVCAIGLSACMSLPSIAYGQSGAVGGVPAIGGIDGGGVAAPAVDGGAVVDGGAAAGGAGGVGGGGGAGATDGEIQTVDPFQLELNILDRRNQGFVGANAEILNQQGFVGNAGNNSNIPLAAESRSSLGGNVNNGLGVRQPPQANQGGGVGGQQNGFTVNRSTMRTRLVPSFQAPRTPGFATQARFESRMRRQPIVNQMPGNISVQIQDRTATMSGTVSNNAEKQMMMRQLRLEPGIYRIVDETTTGN